MRVHINEPRRHNQPAGIYLPLCLSIDLAHPCDSPVLDRDISRKSRASAAIDNRAVSDNYIPGFGRNAQAEKDSDAQQPASTYGAKRIHQTKKGFDAETIPATPSNATGVHSLIHLSKPFRRDIPRE